MNQREEIFLVRNHPINAWKFSPENFQDSKHDVEAGKENYELCLHSLYVIVQADLSDRLRAVRRVLKQLLMVLDWSTKILRMLPRIPVEPMKMVNTPQ